MNCPHHHRIYAASPKSYRDLPLRLAEYGCCYRYEQSGEFFGLMRVRSLNMNDAHIYCTPEQFAAEFNAVNEMYLKYFKIFGIEKYVMRFSTHDPAKLGQKFVDEPELWKQTEDMVRDVLKNSGINFVEVPNEAAFYGPKIDVQVWCVIGKEFTLATNQVDFAVPAKIRPRLHRPRQLARRRRCASTARRWARTSASSASSSSTSPAISRPGSRPSRCACCRSTTTSCPSPQDLRRATSRPTTCAPPWTRTPTSSARKSAAREIEKVPHMLVLGAKEKESGNISARSRVNKAMEGTFPFAQWRELLKAEISTRALPVRV